MATLYELSILSNAVYDTPPQSTNGWVRGSYAQAGGLSQPLQAAIFTKGGETVLAFRGTAKAAADIISDLKLGIGMNTSHFAAAEDFAIRNLKPEDSVVVCGHSLGGAIAQVVANRRNFTFATFNAPGVAVFASRNILTANPGMLAVRTAGAIASAFRYPIQAARDVAATFNVVKGLNVCLQHDLVSKMGVHYGKVAYIAGTGLNPLEQHSIETVISVLKNNPMGRINTNSW